VEKLLRDRLPLRAESRSEVLTERHQNERRVLILASSRKTHELSERMHATRLAQLLEQLLGRLCEERPACEKEQKHRADADLHLRLVHFVVAVVAGCCCDRP